MDDPYIQKLKSLKPRFKELGLKRVRVFGSRVRGDAKEDSDLDLLVDFYDIPSVFELADIQDQLEEFIGKKVDIVFSHKLVPELEEGILKEAQDV